MVKLIALLAAICLFLCTVTITEAEDFELTVLHTNDVHAHIEQFNKYGGTCEPDEAANNECFGGVARRQTVITNIRKNKPNTILIDGGDQFAGTLWFTIYKGEAALRFMNHTKYQAMAIGNHEFDNGPQNLIDFMKQTAFPIVCTNMDVSKEPLWPNPPIYKPSTILDVNGKKVGIIGYTTPDITWLSHPGDKITFSDPVEGVRAEAKKLKANGVNILIALGHAGYSVDQKIAREVSELDLVVGGHTNTFLWNGPKPSVEKVEGPYPFVVERDDGTKCPVVQDFTYGKYLGNLKLTFDENGDLKSWSGNPIMLNASYAEDPTVLAMVKEMDDPIIAARTDPIGRSLVLLEGDRSICRLSECNLGNFLTDAIVQGQSQQPSDEQWATIVLGLWNGGGIRSGNIDKAYDEDITREDLNTISPFGNTADIITIKGKYLKQAFNHGFSGLETNQGRFPQVSGFRLKYDKSRPVEDRLVEAKALCQKCRVPKYELIDDEAIYKVVTSDYLSTGGDGYSALLEAESTTKGEDALQLLENHFKKLTPVSPPNEGRVVDISGDEKEVCSSASQLSINHLVVAIACILVTRLF